MLKNLCRKFSTSKTCKAIVTLFEPDTAVGRNLALLLKMSPNISKLRLYSEKPLDGLLMDISHINTPTKIVNHVGEHGTFKAAFETDMFVIANGHLMSKTNRYPEYLFEKNKSLLDEALYVLNKFEFQPLIILSMEPMHRCFRYTREYLEFEHRYDYKKLLGVYTYAATCINTAVSNRLNIKPEMLNCHAKYGTIHENVLPMIDPTYTLMYNHSWFNRARFMNSINNELVLMNQQMLEMSLPEGPVLTHAHSLAHYINSVCYAIDNNVIVTLSTVCPLVDNTYNLDRGYYLSMPLVINKHGIVDINESYEMSDEKSEKYIDSIIKRHIQQEVDLNKFEPDEIV